MPNRRRILVGSAGFLAIVIAGSFFIRKQNAKRGAQPSAEKAIAGNDSQISADDRQQVIELIRKGDRMLEDGDYVSARSFYEAALKLSPSNAAARSGAESAERAMTDDSTKNKN